MQEQLATIKERFPCELLSLPQWVAWRYEDDPKRPDKPRKMPKNPNTGGNARSNAPTTWGTFEQAVATAEKQGFSGVGFMFAGQHFGVDVDGCRDPENGALDETAQEILAVLPSYAEVSPSGTGIHIICAGALPDGGRGRRRGQVELYGSGRYFTVTGRPAGEARTLADCSERVKGVIARHIDGANPAPPAPGAIRNSCLAKGEASLSIMNALTDREILAKAFAAKGGARLARLYDGRWESDYPSQSEADLALCNALSFWTQGDAARMDGLFRGSGLMRPKWDERHGGSTYSELTIQKAIRDMASTYTPAQRDSTAQSSANDPRFARYLEAYAAVGGYRTSHGMLLAESINQQGEVTTKPLANFVPLISEEVTRDDGVETRREFLLDGVTASGKALSPISVPTGKFAGMAWVIDCWGADANVFPGQTNRDKIRYAVQAASAPLLKRRMVYTHSGWRHIDGKPAFLYHGAAVGAEGVSVELGGSLAMYRLPDSTGDVQSAVAASMALLDMLPPRIAVPLLAHAYLAPLCAPLEAAGFPPAFVLYLAGRSGTRKSIAAALALNHFGAAFNPKRLPASFNDTANAVQQKAFELKDMPLLVDDFAPQTNQIEQRRRSGVAQQLIRAWGDHAERGRMRTDGQLQAAKPPRGLGFMTGEDVPTVGQSGVARLFLVEVQPGDITAGEALTALQQHAQAGDMARAMRGYIEGLIPQFDALPGILGGLFSEYRRLAQERLAGTHGRQPETVAWLLLGFQMALRYWQAVGALADPAPLWTQAVEVLLNHSATQAQAVRDEDPGKLFLDALAELLIVGSARVHDLALPSTLYPDDRRIGFMDADFVYLLPGPAFGAIQEHLRVQGTCFPVSKARLWRHLADAGIVEAWDRDMTKVKHIPSVGTQRFVWLRRSAVPDLCFRRPGSGEERDNTRATQHVQRDWLQTAVTSDVQALVI